MSFSKDKIHSKLPISRVITEHWQTLEMLAIKMGIENKKEIVKLKNKLEYLAEVNYLHRNSNGTMFKLNTFKM